MNVILRPACNRPEMLYLSIESEKVARRYHKFSSDLLTIFAIDAGDNSKVIEIAKSYPFKKKIIVRDKNFGLSKNILKGMEVAFKRSDDYIIYIEDDIVLHKSYFQYMDVLLSRFESKDHSFLSSYGPRNRKRLDHIKKTHVYDPWGCIIYKKFFNEFILPHLTKSRYYNNRKGHVKNLDKKYRNYRKYKYRDSSGRHNEQAGLINRMVDVAMIEEGMYGIKPKMSRTSNIGFYGKNRPGSLKGKNFRGRLKKLEKAFKSGTIDNLSAQPGRYRYHKFSDELENWDGTLSVVIK